MSLENRKIEIEFFVLQHHVDGYISGADLAALTPSHCSSITGAVGFHNEKSAAEYLVIFPTCSTYDIVKVYRRDIAELSGKSIFDFYTPDDITEIHTSIEIDKKAKQATMEKKQRQRNHPVVSFFRGIKISWKHDSDDFRLKLIFYTWAVFALTILPLIGIYFHFINGISDATVFVLGIGLVIPAGIGIVGGALYWMGSGIWSWFTRMIVTGRNNY